MTFAPEPTWNATLLQRWIRIGDDLPRADYDRTRQQRPPRAITVAGPHTATINWGASRGAHPRPS
jgi:hypothetical protein